MWFLRKPGTSRASELLAQVLPLVGRAVAQDWGSAAAVALVVLLPLAVEVIFHPPVAAV